MKIELIEDKSTGNPDEAAIMAARGDKMEDSLVGKTIEEVLEDVPLEAEYICEVLDGDDERREYFEDLIEDGGEESFPWPTVRDAKKHRMIASLLRSGHWGPFEHPQAYFAVEDVSRVAMAQITRHRHMSFDVQSQRYVDFSEKEGVMPPSFEECDEEITIDEGYQRYDVSLRTALKYHWKDSVAKYDAAVEAGIPKEDARFFLPQATPVHLSFSANPRSLMHFFDLRKNMKAQWEAREFATQVLEECREWAPLTFDAYEEYTNNNSLRAP